MRHHPSITACGLAACLVLAAASAAAAETSYPDWSGQWVRIGGTQFDPAKAPGLGQAAPLTPEYQAIFAKTLQKPTVEEGDRSPTVLCLPTGMPRSMIAQLPMEIVVRPEMVVIMLSYLNGFRHIFTDGRDWPAEMETNFDGTSIGHWDAPLAGAYHVLTVETRGMNGPRTFDASGLPLHEDNETIVTERIFLDSADPDVLHDEITTIDHALTRPWTVTRSYHRQRDTSWPDYVCAEEHQRTSIDGEIYAIGADGRLMPTRPGQPAPDLKFFKPAVK